MEGTQDFTGRGGEPAPSAAPAQGGARTLPHPYDTATGTIALGVLLTVALALAVRFLAA